MQSTTPHTAMAFSEELVMLFQKQATTLLKTTTSIPTEQKVVDQKYLMGLILHGQPADFARAIHLPFHEEVKSVYGDMVKIFYHFYDSCFSIYNFSLQYPSIVEYILDRNMQFAPQNECQASL